MANILLSFREKRSTARLRFDDFFARHGRALLQRLPLARLLAGNARRRTSAPLPDAELANEISNTIFAATTDTTAKTLTNFSSSWRATRQWYARLRSEIAAGVSE
jgi:hypothetical protein